VSVMWDIDDADDPTIPLPDNYAARVVRQAVLVPLRGKLGDRASIVAAAESVRASWRARVADLGALGWEPAQGKGRKSMIHCRRAFTLPDPQARCCNHRMICPDCWGRQVLDVWKRIDVAMFPPPLPLPKRSRRMPSIRRCEPISDDEPYPPTGHARHSLLELFERVLEYPLPFAGMDVKAGPEARSLPAWLAMRLKAGALATSTGSLQNRAAELRRFAALGCVGILDVTCPWLDTRTDGAPAAEGGVNLEVPESGRSAVGWRAQVRQVFVVPYERADEVEAHRRISDKPHSVFGIEGTVRLVRHDRPSRRRVMAAVARAMAYPKTLLHGPPELALEVLKARAPYRMIMTTGTFRQRAGRPDA
jgi:hypothetical protein